MLLTVEIIVAWASEKRDPTASKNLLALCKAIDQIMEPITHRKVDHASFPNVYKDGYTSYGEDGHVVQTWSLVLVGKIDLMKTKRGELERVVDAVRPYAAAVRFKSELT